MAVEITVCALAGGLAGLLLLAAFDPLGQATDMDSVSFIVGAAIGVGFNRMLRG